MAKTDAERAEEALSKVEVKQFALQGTRETAEAVAMAGDLNLARRHGGGRWPRGVGSLAVKHVGDGGWAAVFSTPFMGMEWGGIVTWVFGNPFGTNKRAGRFPSMWAPWHRDYEKGYIIGSAWTSMNEQEVTAKQADQVLRAYTKAFDEAGLRRG